MKNLKRCQCEFCNCPEPICQECGLPTKSAEKFNCPKCEAPMIVGEIEEFGCWQCGYKPKPIKSKSELKREAFQRGEL